MAPTSRLRRWTRRLAKVLLFCLLGVTLLVGLVLLSVNLPPVSGFITGKVNAALEPMFKGRLVLHRLGSIDFGGILGAEVEVYDPEGRSVLYARDLDVRLFWPAVVWDAVVTRPDPLVIPFERIALDSIDVTVIDDGAGTPTLALAFEPKEPPQEESSGGTELRIEDLVVETTRVRGSLESFGPIDADLTRLDLSLKNGPSGTHVVLEHLELALRQLPQVDTLTGRLTADITLPAAAPPAPAPGADEPADAEQETTVYALTPAPARRIVAELVGAVAGSPAELDVRMLGEQLEATFEATSLSPATVNKLVPALSPASPAALSAKVDGEFGDLGFEALLRQGEARVNARGRVKMGDERSVVTARVDTSDVDLSELMRDSVATRLNIGADAQLSFGEAGGEGTYEIQSTSSRVGVERLPGVTVDGKVRLPTNQPISATGSVEIAEEGAPTHIEYDVRSGDAGVLAKLSSKTRVSRPPRVRELLGLMATGAVETRATFDSAADQLDAEVTVRLSDIRHPALKARELHASALARGSATAPALELLANLTGVTASERTWTRVRLSAKGTAEQVAVSARAWGDKPDLVELSAMVFPSSEEMVRSPEVRVTDATGDLLIRAAGVTLAGESVEVKRLTLEGPGRAEVSLSYGPGLERLDLRTEQLDSAALLEILGIETPLRGGKLDLSAQFQNGRQPSGKVVLDIGDLTLGELSGGKVSADLVLEGGELSGDAGIELARGAKTSLTIESLRPPRGPLTARALESVTGGVSLQGEIDLSQLQPLLPLGGIERAAGHVRFDVQVRRPPNGELPEWRAHLETRKLIIVEERPDLEQTKGPEQARASSPFTLRGMDLELDAALANQAANVKVRVFDEEGTLLESGAEWKGIAGRADLMNARAALLSAPWTAFAHVPRRALQGLPPLVRPNDIQGTLQASITAEGTLADPRLDLRARIEQFGPGLERKQKRGLDLELGGQYAKTGGGVQLRGHDRKVAVVDVSSHWTGDAMALGEAGEKSPVRAELGIELADFPLELIPLLEAQHISGKLSGNGRLDGYGEDARFALDVRTDDLRIDRLIMDEVAASVTTEGGKLTLLTNVSGKGGQANAKVTTGLTWGERLVPLVDEQQLEGAFKARKLRLSALLPLLAGSVSELDGELDADLSASMENGTPQLSGRVSLAKGAVHLPSVGQRFHDISAKAEISPESIRVHDVKARGINGGFEASAEAALEGLTPVSAKAELRIDEDDKLPLTIEGEAVGDAWGNIEVTYRQDEASKTNNVNVSLEKFNVELPAAPPRGIQGLEQSEHIRVGYWRQDREFVEIPLQPLKEPGAPSEYTTVVVVELGSMRIEKGQQAQVGLGGRIQATLGEELDVRGKIETRRGELDISGKKFDIERGSVTFTGGAPDDPTISAVARYDSGAGYTVYAEYTGTATRGKLELRSEPPLSQDEILTLLMFGTPDGSFGAGSGDSLTTAVGVAGGTAAQGLNRALSDVTDLDVSARVDTSTGAPRPELVVQLTPRVAARVTQALGEPPPGQSPDRTFLTIELRLASAWALSAMVGDRGASALDLIWRRRY